MHTTPTVTKESEPAASGTTSASGDGTTITGCRPDGTGSGGSGNLNNVAFVYGDHGNEPGISGVSSEIPSTAIENGSDNNPNSGSKTKK